MYSASERVYSKEGGGGGGGGKEKRNTEAVEKVAA